MAVTVDSTDGLETDLHHNAVNVLLAIYDQEDKTATTTEIRHVTGISSANISGGHAQKLEERGLIEKTGSVETEAPIATNEYKATPRGLKESKRLLKQTPAEIPMSEGKKLALLNFLEEHREEIKAFSAQSEQTSSIEEQQLDDLAEQVEENTEKLDDHASAFERVFNILNKKVLS